MREIAIVEPDLTTATAAATPNAELAPVVEDMSAWIIAGQVTSQPRESEWESAYRTPAQGVEDGVEAERLGIRRVFLSERWNFKEAGAFLAAVAARTTRLVPPLKIARSPSVSATTRRISVIQ